MTDHSYRKIQEWKDQHIRESMTDTRSLNDFHDTVMKKAFEAAVQKIDKGQPPCKFSWFITGSGGRLEQGVTSDQDHGLIYEIENKENHDYFFTLGKELSDGLNAVGYPYCTGNIMSSNPLWCKSFDSWKKQLYSWMEEKSWETIRYLQIFYDARNIVGTNQMIHQLKDLIFQYQKDDQELIVRFAENVKHTKKGVGPMGNILIEEKGEHHGSINIKYTAFLPYVNSIRLLAIKEGLYETSTCDRMDRLMENMVLARLLHGKKEHFEALLQLRLLSIKEDTYEDSHYLNTRNLSNRQKALLKQIIKEGQKLHKQTINQVKKGVQNGI